MFRFGTFTASATQKHIFGLTFFLIVSNSFCSMDLRICAHVRTSNWQFVTSYRGYNIYDRIDREFCLRLCSNGRSNALSQEFPHMPACLKCHKAGTITLFGFIINHSEVVDEPGNSDLYVDFFIVRNLIILSDLDCASWTVHSSIPAISSQIRPSTWRCWQEEVYRRQNLWMDTQKIATR